jgi:hypothetical protein
MANNCNIHLFNAICYIERRDKMIQVNTLKGFEDVQDYYYVEYDTVYSKKGKLKALKPGKARGGYHSVALQDKNGKQKTYRVHRIVCTAYHENPNSLPEVNHINHDRTDNRPENLEWADHRGNTAGNNIWVEKQKEGCKARQKKVMLIDEENCKVIVFQSLKQCAEYLGVHKSAINNALKRGRPCKGYELKNIE